MERTTTSASWRQLSPTTRYYIRKLLLQALEMINSQRQEEGEAPLEMTHLGQATDDLDTSIEDLLNRSGQGAEKIAELERLALLFQGLSSEGTTFRTQMMSMVEDKVADLLGLALITPSVSEVWSQDSYATAPIPSSPLTRSALKPAPQPTTLYEYLTLFNVISRISKKYIGASVTANYWQSCRPDDDWLAQIQISETGEFCQIGINFELTPEQCDLMLAWGKTFASRCSRVIRNFERVLQAANIHLLLDDQHR
jgi:hypothetical protein